MAYDFNSLTKQADEASNRDKFYTDFGDVDPSKLHQISELTSWMRTKAKGSDVREIIAQLFERTWLENIKEGNANMEVSLARGSYPNLKSRLDNFDNKQQKNTEQLAQKANKDEVTNVMTPKGTLAYASLPTSGNQVGWFYYCPDGDGTHGAGNYVWNGSSWFFGGTGNEGYNLLKKDLDYLTKSTKNILFTNNKFVGGYVSNTYGQIGSNDEFETIYIDIDKNKNLSFNDAFLDSRILFVSKKQDMSSYSIGDIIDGFIAGSGLANVAPQNYTPPSNAIGLLASIKIDKENAAQIEYGDVSTDYVKPRYGVDGSKILGNVLHVGIDMPFDTIQSAVDSASDNDVIYVHNGTYHETVDCKTKFLSIIGESKHGCIIEYENGNYDLPPIEMSKGVLKNFTIHAIAQSQQSGAKAKAYCLHIDWNYSANSSLYVENVKFVNDDKQVVGIGMKPNFELVFNDCEFICKGNDNAFYCHTNQSNGQGYDNQHLTVKNSVFVNNGTKNTIQMQSQEHQERCAVATFQRNIVKNKGSNNLLGMIVQPSTMSQSNWLGSSDWILDETSALNTLNDLNLI